MPDDLDDTPREFDEGGLGAGEPEDVDAVRASMDVLFREIDELPDPLRGLWSELDAGDIERLLKTLGLAAESVLRDFGAPSPRRANRATANHLRKAVANTNARRRLMTLLFLTKPVVSAFQDGTEDEAVEEWGTDLCRVALTAASLSRHGDHFWVPLAVRSLIDLGLIPEPWASASATLRAAAGEFMDAVLTAHGTHVPGEDADTDVDESLESTYEDEIKEALAVLEQAELPAWVDGHLAVFRSAVESARAVAADLLAATETGYPPGMEAVKALVVAIGDAHRAADYIRFAVSHVGAGEVPEVRLAALESAAENIASLIDPAAGAVRRLAGVRGPAGADSVIQALHEAAGAFEQRAFVLALVELIDAATEGAGPLRIAELDGAARRVAPDDLASAVVLATTGNLQLPTPPGPAVVTPTPIPPETAEESGPVADAPPDPDGGAHDESGSVEVGEVVPSDGVVAAAKVAPTHAEPGIEKPAGDESAVAEPVDAGPTDAEPVVTATKSDPVASETPAGDGSVQGLKTESASRSGATAKQVAAQPFPASAPKPASSRLGAFDSAGDAADDVAREAETERVAACEELMIAALVQRRFALAWWASVSSHEPARLLRLAALGAEVHTSSGPVAEALKDMTLGLSRRDYGPLPGVQVLAAVAAVRAALVAPNAGTSSVAVDLARMLSLPGLSGLADATAIAANRGVTLAGDTLSGLGDTDRLDNRIRERAREARDLLRKERRFNFQRASEIWKQWTASGDLLGAVLGPVAADDRVRAGEVAAAAEALRGRGAIERALRDADHRLRGSGSKRIEGSARNHLLEDVATAAELARDWCTDVAQLTRSTRDAGWLDAPTTNLRAAATTVEGEVRSELRGTAIDPVSAAAAGAASELLDDVYGLLSGQPPVPGHERPERILGLDLLAGDTRVDDKLEPAEDLVPARLAPGLDRGLPEAFAARAARGDHLASGLIVEVLRTTDPAGAEELAVTRAAQVRTAEVTTTKVIDGARDMLDQARRQLYVSEDRYAELSARVEGAARPGRVDFDAVGEELRFVGDEISTDRRAAQTTFLSGLAEAAADYPGVAGARDRIAELASTDLATASEWLALAVDGRSLTDTSESPFSLDEIWPSVAEVVGAGVADAVVEDAAARRDHGALRFSTLPVDAAERAASALRKWRRISKGAARRNEWLDELRPVLRLLGVDAGGVDTAATKSLPSSPQRQWVELTGVVRTGKALVPAFGSKAATRMRVLVAFGAPTETTLLEWATPDNSDRPVMVFHVGTLPLEFRARFAAACRDRRSRPEIVLVDDTVVAWAAARGEFRFEPVMRAVLPFVATNPYLPPSGDCPPELFYGRSEARRALVDSQGSCLLYGGRQLGKSALLRSTVRDFGAGMNQVACYIDLKPASIGSTRRADVVWEMLWSRLGEHGVTPAGRGAGRDPATKVAEAVRAFLASDEGRRILVCLDECDDFFDVDAATNFGTTSRLKDLMDHTGRRFKVVWAGLHQVARFANIPNQPLAHLGRPIAIGPLDPSAAHRLIAEPMRALGIDFARPDLVNRVLAYCNYQPVLLHLFGQALVEQMLFPPQGPVPVVVHASDVEAVASSPTLQHEIRERFELTLGLDPRYRVIAYTVAYEAHARGVEVALSASELRAACERWWPAGFASLDPAEFRAVLEEMASLGVLAASLSRSGWRLRSPNVLRMLGTMAQVEDRLLEEESREPTWLVTTEARRVLPDGRRSPVTEGQLADLVGEGRNQVRVVVGSEATCVEALADAVRSVADATGRFRLRRPGKFETYSRDLVEGTVGEHFVVLSDLRGVSPDSFAKSLIGASARVPAKGGTRSVLVVADATNFDSVADLVDPAGEALAGVEVTSLRRLDLRGLGAWALEVESAFQDDEARRQLAKITGGWPILLEHAAALAREGRGTAAIISEMQARMVDPAGAAALIAAVGLGEDGPMPRLVEFLASSSGASLNAEDLVVFVEGHDHPGAVVAMLRSLGVLEPASGAEGELRLEPVLCRCWESAGPAAVHASGSDPAFGNSTAE